VQAVQNTSYTITIDYKHDDLSSTTNKDPARVSGVDVYNNSIHLFTDTVTSSGSTINFNQQDQITGRQTVTVEGAASSTVTTTTQNYTYGYDANHGDALTSMSGTQYATVVVASPPSTTTTTTSLSNNYAFDNVGNFTGNSTLGTASNVNQYGGLINNARGDVTDDGTYAYSYDANDRLIVVTPHDNAQLQLKYGYDSQGRRLWKTAYSYTGGVWAPSYSRHYLWDGNNLVAELDGSNALLTGYIWGPTGLLAVTDYTASGGPKTYVVAQDLSGNVVALISPYDGTLAAMYRYDPYGNPLSATGAAKDVNSIRGKGLQVDIETPDIQHALMRDARMNQWLEKDPAGEFQGGFNLHQLYGGDPINKSDPSGLSVTFNFRKQVAVLPDGSRSSVYGLYKTTELWVPPTNVMSKPRTTSETELVGMMRHVVSGSDALERETAFEGYLNGMLDAMKDTDDADRRVEGLQTLFGLLPMFSVIDHITQGHFDEFDAVETVLSVVPVACEVAPEAGALLRGARVATSAETAIASRAMRGPSLYSTGDVVTSSEVLNPGILSTNPTSMADEAAELGRMATNNATVEAKLLHNKINLRGAVAAEQERVMATMGYRARGPMVGGVMDSTTGRVFFGLNTEGILASDLHPALVFRIGEPLHGEIVALNKALWDRGVKAEIDDTLLLYNRRFGVTRSASMPRCDVCKEVSSGVFSLSDSAR
jgi:hypothetical protein